MLQPTWYLTDTDWLTQLTSAPRLDPDGQAVIGQVADLFSNESFLSPAKSVAATHVLLLAAGHLGDVLSYAARKHDLADLTRLAAGLNLVQSHVTQIVQRVAEHAHVRAFRDFDTVPAWANNNLIASLSTAGVNGEISAAHLKEAHLILRGLTR